MGDGVGVGDLDDVQHCRAAHIMLDLVICRAAEQAWQAAVLVHSRRSRPCPSHRLRAAGGHARRATTKRRGEELEVMDGGRAVRGVEDLAPPALQEVLEQRGLERRQGCEQGGTLGPPALVQGERLLDSRGRGPAGRLQHPSLPGGKVVAAQPRRAEVGHHGRGQPAGSPRRARSGPDQRELRVGDVEQLGPEVAPGQSQARRPGKGGQ
mmetsp:Transcript_25158/g.72516  ORF Transcript_25158/g.72516 Transcript_25158/m.72516 type:complete len:209 (-) Transcript_25158:148-774(-)